MSRAGAFLRTLTILCAASLPAEAGTEAIEVQARPAAGVTVQSEAFLRLEPDQTAPGTATAVEVPVTVPGRTEVRGLAPGSWHARLISEGYWGEEKEVVVAPSAVPVVSLRLFPAAQIRGTLVFPRTSRLPGSVTIDFAETPRYGPQSTDEIPESSATCEVVGKEFTCTVPAGHLDLRVHTPGMAPVYFWGIESEHGQERRLGELRMVEGSSIVGWVQDEDGQPLNEIAVRLAAAVAPGMSDPVLSQRLKRQRFETMSNERGFFQITGVSEGTFRITATGESFAETRSEDLVVVGDSGEERLEDPLVMMRPAVFELVLDPPLDPWGRAWTADILSMGESNYVRERIRSVVSPEGVWRQVGLVPGAYFLQVFDSAGSRWIAEEIDVDALSRPHVIDVPIVEVVGTVTRDGDAVPGSLKLAGERSTVEFEVDEEGEFAGFLPDEDQFGVILSPAELEDQRTTLVLEPVELDRRDGRKAVLDIAVPNTRLEGDVVNGDGRPVPGARVRLRASEARQQRNSTETDEEGSFAFWGIPPGDVLVGAVLAAEESNTVLVHLAEDTVLPRLRLQLLGNVRISGQIVASNGPLAGAHLLAWPDDMKSHNVSFRNIGSDVDGSFQIDLRETATWINLLVRAPGFATRFVREAVDPERPILISMEKHGGNLVLDLPTAPSSGGGEEDDLSSRPSMPLLIHDGVAIPAAVLGMISPSARRNEAAVGGITLHNIESGQYSLCEASTTMPGSTQPLTSQCTSGFLSPGSVLELSLSGQGDTGRGDSSEKGASVEGIP